MVRTRGMPGVCRSAVMLLLVAASSLAASPGAKTVKTLTVGKASVGLEWSARWQLDPDSPGLTADGIAFRTADALAMRAYLTWVPMRDELSTDDGIRELTKQIAKSLESQTVEKEIEIRHLAGDHAHGYYFCVTDKAPKAGEYQYMCQGMVSVDGTPIVFNVVYNEPGTADAQKVVAAIKTLQLSTGT